jgi:hypothetical protein
MQEANHIALGYDSQRVHTIRGDDQARAMVLGHPARRSAQRTVRRNVADVTADDIDELEVLDPYHGRR